MTDNEITTLTGQPLSDAVGTGVMKMIYTEHLTTGVQLLIQNWHSRDGKVLYGFNCESLWQPHRDLNQCMEVVKAVDRDGFVVNKTELREYQNFDPHKGCEFSICANWNWQSVRAKGTTPHEAILRACLMAVVGK